MNAKAREWSLERPCNQRLLGIHAYSRQRAVARLNSFLRTWKAPKVFRDYSAGFDQRQHDGFTTAKKSPGRTLAKGALDFLPAVAH